jgi:hypothetical protein
MREIESFTVEKSSTRCEIGDTLFVIGGQREAHVPAKTHPRAFAWEPASASVGRVVSAHLDEWNWDSPEARELYRRQTCPTTDP